MKAPVEKKTDPSESPRRLFAYELREWRRRAGLAQKQLGERIGYSAGMVASAETLESPRRRTSPSAAIVPRRRWHPLSHLEDGQDGRPEWFRPWSEVESEATTLKSGQPLDLPGLLRTEACAYHVLKGEPGIIAERLEHRLATRLARRAILERENPPDLWVVIDEGVLARPIGSPSVMRERLLYPAETLQQMNHVSVQVLPFAAGCTSGVSGAFAIARLRVGIPDTVYLETAHSGHMTEDPESLQIFAVGSR